MKWKSSSLPSQSLLPPAAWSRSFAMMAKSRPGKTLTLVNSPAVALWIDTRNLWGSYPVITNLIFFKSVWALSLFGASTGAGWLGTAGLLVFVGWHIYSSETARADLQVAACAVIIGLTLDTLYLRAGLIAYSGEVFWTGFAPLWIIALWANLALTLNGCLRWMQSRLLLTSGLALVFGPLGYYGGVTLGAASVTGNPIVLYGAIGIAWATALPLLLKLAERLRAQASTSRGELVAATVNAS